MSDTWGSESAEKALGLCHQDAQELFFPNGTIDDDPTIPSPYDAGPREAAKVIRGLLETGEVDWKAAMKGEGEG